MLFGCIFHISQDNTTLFSVVHFFPIQDLEDTRASPVFPESELLMRRLYGSTLFWKEQDICGCISFLMLL